MNITDRGLSEEQRMMRDSCRTFVDDFVIPFIRQNWQQEWVIKAKQARPFGAGQEAARSQSSGPVPRTRR
jgi:hypothetical protein